MKKSLVTAGCFFLLAVAALPVAACYVDQGKNAIIITQEVVTGDPKAASGIVLQMENTWNNHLFWETEYAIGSDGPAESKFTFYAGQLHDPAYSPVREHARFRDTLSYSYGSGYGAPGLDPGAVPVPETVREMVRQAGPREAVVSVMPVRDLYEYWPVSVDLASDSHAFSYFQEYRIPELFQIPVPEDAMAEITIQKDADNRCTLLQCNAKSGAIDIISTGTFGTEGCYLAYYCVDAQDRDLMPPGTDYGIYYVPYHPEGVKEIRKVTGLEADCMPIALEADEETGQLWALILQDGRYYLDLLDITGGGERQEEGYCRLVQRIAVLDTGSAADTGAGLSTGAAREPGLNTEPAVGKEISSPARMTLVPGGVLLTWQEDGLFAFVSEDSDGGYTLWCVDHFPEGQDDTGNTLFPTEQALLFDGKRLVLAAYPDFMSNNVQLAVFTKEGLAYYGRYRHSGEWDREQEVPGGWIHPVGIIDSGEIRRTENPLRLRFD